MKAYKEREIVLEERRQKYLDIFLKSQQYSQLIEID